MRYKVELRYREDTGEIELLQVEVVEDPSGRVGDHDAQHDRVAGEIARVVQPGAEIVEVGPEREVATGQLPEGRSRTEEAAQSNEPPRQVN
jgi:hypothetical protein